MTSLSQKRALLFSRLSINPLAPLSTLGMRPVIFFPQCLCYLNDEVTKHHGITEPHLHPYISSLSEPTSSERRSKPKTKKREMVREFVSFKRLVFAREASRRLLRMNCLQNSLHRHENHIFEPLLFDTSPLKPLNASHIGACRAASVFSPGIISSRVASVDRDLRGQAFLLGVIRLLSILSARGM